MFDLDQDLDPRPGWDTEKIGQPIWSWLKRKTGETESGPGLGDPRTLLIYEHVHEHVHNLISFEHVSLDIQRSFVAVLAKKNKMTLQTN